jgi:hypothetical protein
MHKCLLLVSKVENKRYNGPLYWLLAIMPGLNNRAKIKHPEHLAAPNVRDVVPEEASSGLRT